MLIAEVAALTPELEAEASKNTTTEVQSEVETEATTEIATPLNPEEPKTEVTKEVKAEINKVSSIVYITHLPPNLTSYFTLALSHQPQQNTNSSSARQHNRHPSHLSPSTSLSTSTS